MSACTYTPKDYKLAVTFTGHVTSKAKKKGDNDLRLRTAILTHIPTHIHARLNDSVQGLEALD